MFSVLTEVIQRKSFSRVTVEIMLTSLNHRKVSPTEAWAFSLFKKSWASMLIVNYYLLQLKLEEVFDCQY